jgi:hypothetical protein
MQAATAALTPPVSSSLLANGSFESPSVGSSYQYAPTGASWTFGRGTGISGNRSTFTNGNPNAPDGTQVAFLQGAGANLSQTVTLAAGNYKISLKAAQRGGWQQGTQIVQIKMDGNAVGQYQPPSTNYSDYQTASFTATAGSHTISLIGVGSGSDFTAFVDNVVLTPA